MNTVEQALEFANYQATLSHQKKLIKQRFEDRCVVAFNGGLFKVTPEFITGLSVLTQSWVLDSNNNPINVGSLHDFIEMCVKTYNEALVEYGTSYEQLKRQRSISSLVGI